MPEIETDNPSSATRRPRATDRSPWNSLEIAKLLLGALTPIAIFALGYAVNYHNAEQAKQHDAAVQHAASTERLLDKRFEFWEKISPILMQVELTVRNTTDSNLPEHDLLMAYRQCSNLRTLYAGFLSARFLAVVDEYLRRFEQHVRWVGEVRAGSRRYDPADGQALLEQYARLRDAVQPEMSASVGPAEH